MNWKKHYYSEISNYCNKLYKQNFPNSIELGDITKINTRELLKDEKNWIITGGFPCQDISIAGKRKGLSGDRSGLWFEMLRIISELRPKFAIVENVPGLIISGGLGQILSGFAKIRYDAEWQTISAKQIGAWHRRERIWIVAYPIGQRSQSWVAKKKYTQGVRVEAPGGNSPEIWNKKIESKLSGMVHGLPRRMDRIEALGNSIVPQIAEYLFTKI